MEGNDLLNYDTRGFGIVFEGLLASPPERTLRSVFRSQVPNWERDIHRWKANELPLKSLIDTSSRLGIGCEVYTFLSEDAVDPIERWLSRKGVSVPAFYYEDATYLEYDLRFNRSIRTILVPTDELAQIIGIRARVTPTDRGWML
jgi:hypothetical protein